MSDRPMWVSSALGDVMSERHRQDEKWGEQNHDPFVFLAILHEESGELALAALKARFEAKDFSDFNDHTYRIREEAVQVAAVALALLECLDRGKWTWGGHALPPEVTT